MLLTKSILVIGFLMQDVFIVKEIGEKVVPTSDPAGIVIELGQLKVR